MKFFVLVKVCPNCQLDGATLLEVNVRPSLPVTLNDRAWPTRSSSDCQFWPQLHFMSIYSGFVPFTLTLTISPAPATLVISTKLKYWQPLIVNLIPPCFLHGTLKNNREKEKAFDLDAVINFLCPLAKIVGFALQGFVCWKLNKLSRARATDNQHSSFY
ncbi:Unknown protein [Striga hermonthica]|uniref:Uncharacterized protein n=1 Tax=Striga hermonthica TaxID=68872 RepID=A0A9N7NDN2_STRHE|nr:Unknown protein [Striga hermonthica]